VSPRKVAPLVLPIAAFLAYHNSFSTPFVFDDVQSIPENPTIRHLGEISRVLSPPATAGVADRPVVNLSFAINYALGGTAVWGYHVLNLVIHILAALTLFGVVRRTLLRPVLKARFEKSALWLALGIALIWTLHPLQTEAVTYISQRCESLMGLFYLLTLYCFIRGIESNKPARWFTLSVASCALGMATKEVMATVPIMVLLYDRTFAAGSFRQAWTQRWRLYLALAATWLLLLGLMSGLSQRDIGYSTGVSWSSYALAECWVILQYLRLTIWPHPLIFDYGTEMLTRPVFQALLYVPILLALLAGVLWALNRRPVLGFLGAWFLLILAPTSSVVPIINSPMAEHRVYLSLAAIISLVVIGIYQCLGRQWLTVVFVIAAGLGFLTVSRNDDYRSNLSLWTDTATRLPSNRRAYCNIGYSLFRMGRAKESIRYYQQALAIDPDYVAAHNNLGISLLQLGDAQDALKHFERSVQLKPNSAPSHYNLGNALARAGKLDDAVRENQEAIRLNGGYRDAYYNLGSILVSMGKVSEAVTEYQNALRIDPDYAEAHLNLGNALMLAGRTSDAIDQYESALRIRPGYAEAHSELGVALLVGGRRREAMAQFEEALRIKPDYAEPQNNLAWLLATLPRDQGGDPTRAVELAQRAVTLNGGHSPGGLDTLAVAYASAGRFDEAIATAQEAAVLARATGQPKMAREIEARLALYHTGRPFRESPPPASPGP